MKWLLDANVISLLFEGDAEAALDRALAKGLALASTARVLDEVRRTDPRKRPWATRIKAWNPPAALEVFDMVLGDPIFERWTRLRAQYAAGDKTGVRDDGELVCIAHAMGDPSLILVAHDRNALWRATHEVRPHARVASALVFFDALLACGAVDRAIRDGLGELGSVRDHRPTWWL